VPAGPTFVTVTSTCVSLVLATVTVGAGATGVAGVAGTAGVHVAATGWKKLVPVTVSVTLAFGAIAAAPAFGGR